MAKNFPYFKFNTTEWLTGNIVFESLEYQGLFINICSLYWQKDGHVLISDLQNRFKNCTEMDALSDRLANSSDRFVSLSGSDKNKICIKFLDEQLAEIALLSEKNAMNGRKGGGVKRLKDKEIKATAKRNQATAKRPLSKEEEDKEEDIIILSNKLDRSAKFKPPQLSEVIEFFNEKNVFEISHPEKFFNHFESNGWKVSGKTPMKNWKAAASNWIARSIEFQSEKNIKNGKPKSNQPASTDSITAAFAQPPVFVNLGDFSSLKQPKDS